MKRIKTSCRWIVLMFIFLLVGCQGDGNEVVSEANVTIHYIDVGQGDSTLIRSDDGVVLIDGGENETEDSLIQYLQQNNVRSIDYLVATHPHSDHIGGLDGIIKAFDVKNVIMPNVAHTTTTFSKFIEASAEKKCTVTKAKAGEQIQLNKITLTILAPNSDSYENINNYSVVLRMEHGKNSFLFGADAEKLSEKEMLERGNLRSTDVLKVGHHGSNTSSSEEFLDAVRPSIGIISCGKENDYGHPNEEVLKALEERNVSLFRTDLLGTIVLVSDGETITIADQDIGSPKIGNDSEVGALPEGDIVAEPEKSQDEIHINENGEGLIKGNVNSKGEKIYHMPGGASYKNTDPEMLFKTEAEAQKEGFRRAKR